MSDQEPTVYNGRYELHRQIARGGMADVFLARDQLLDRPVAIKVLFPQFASDPSFVERFRREAQSAANLNHPNIVSVYDWGEEQGTYFIVMEYVEGRSLAEILRTEGMLHPDRAADITTDVAAALSFAHRNGVVHRDIKPGNILIAPSGQVKVTDFGIARAFGGGQTDANLTQAGSVMGTATYFSPEQAQGHQVDPRSDLYSLGIVLYEMLASRPPFSGESPVAIAYKHVQEAPAPPSHVNPRVPATIEAITMQLLAKSPSNRYPSAEDLRADLRRFREGQPVLAAGDIGGSAAPAATVAAPAATTAVPVTPAPSPTYTEVQDDYYDDPPSRTGWFIAGLVVLIAVLVGLLLVFADALGIGGDDEGDATLLEVPAVLEMTEDAASALLRAEGFVPVVEHLPHGEEPEGIVFDQDPAAGERLEEGSEVEISVSSGAEPFPMDDVVGSTEEAARELLESQDLVVADVVYQPDDEAIVGEVIGQTPEPGTEVRPGDSVTLVVSQGPDTVAIPGVEGRTPAEARTILGDAGFEVREGSEPSDSVPEGRVTRTEPPMGTEAAANSTVTIFVSEGPPPPDTATVPNVVNQTQATAEAQITNRGFNPQVSFANHPSVPSGTVIRQDPESGTELELGSNVEIVVSRGPAEETTTTTTADD